MANELTKMREIRINQHDVRVSLKNREEKNKNLREQITPIWVLEKDKRTEELTSLTKSLVDGRAKVREYQYQLGEFKRELRATNRAYDYSKA